MTEEEDNVDHVPPEWRERENRAPVANGPSPRGAAEAGQNDDDRSNAFEQEDDVDQVAETVSRGQEKPGETDGGLGPFVEPEGRDGESQGPYDVDGGDADAVVVVQGKGANGDRKRAKPQAGREPELMDPQVILEDLDVAHGQTMAVILQERGDTEIMRVKRQLVDAATGAYVAAVRGRYLVTQTIPRGSYIVPFMEGNPQPMMHYPVPENGYGSRELGNLTGGKLSHAIGQGHKDGRQPIGGGRIMLYIAVGVGLLVTGMILFGDKVGV